MPAEGAGTNRESLRSLHKGNYCGPTRSAEISKKRARRRTVRIPRNGVGNAAQSQALFLGGEYKPIMNTVVSLDNGLHRVIPMLLALMFQKLALGRDRANVGL